MLLKFHWHFILILLLFLLCIDTIASSSRRTKRYVLNKNKWNRCIFTWAFRDPFRIFHSKANFDLAKSAIENVVRMWENGAENLIKFFDVSPTYNKSQLKRVANIDVFFAVYEHNDTEYFDGPGGMVAHTTYPVHGSIHFDASEKWSVNGIPLPTNKFEKNNQFIDLRFAALHEFGHALGLRHSASNGSVMNRFYSVGNGSLRLSKDDYLGIQELFNHCRYRRSSINLNSQSTNKKIKQQSYDSNKNFFNII